MSSPKKTDGNHQDIINYYRDCYCSVFSTHAVGGGFPDLVVGLPFGLTLAGNFDPAKVQAALVGIEDLVIYEGATILVEVKDENQPPSKRKLRPLQKEFFRDWRGLALVVKNKVEVLASLGLP